MDVLKLHNTFYQKLDEALTSEDSLSIGSSFHLSFRYGVEAA
jgi:hypothetical protein